MKKIYSKVLVSAFVAASSFFGAQAEEVVVLQENFNKLEVLTEAGIHKYGKNPWTKTDAEGVEYQPNYTNIQTDGNVADLNGWSSRTSYMYACQGFVRISKTNNGGDLISPKFASLTEATDVKLSWQGIGYSSAFNFNADGTYKSGGTHDYQYYGVTVLGAGEIEGAAKTTKVNYFDAEGKALVVDAAVVEIPSDCFITGDTLQAWGFEGTKNELTIKGATAEFPIATDAPHKVNKGANRVIFDNIKVSYNAISSAITDVTAAKEVKARKVIENGQIYIIAGDKKYNMMGAEVK